MLSITGRVLSEPINWGEFIYHESRMFLDMEYNIFEEYTPLLLNLLYVPEEWFANNL